MESYLDGVEEKDFTSLVENEDFKKDLVRFFRGDRYEYSDKDLNEKGFDGLANDFAEHMRFQEWNDATAIKDLNYINNKEANPTSKESFGRLIQAWDSSAGAGTGYGTATLDFTQALVQSPSTYLGFGSLGTAKVAAKGLTKLAQMAVRRRIQDYFKKKAVLKGMVTGATVEGAVGGVQSYGMGESREALADQGNFIEGYEYSKGDLVKDVALNATVGAVLGGAGGHLNKKIALKKDLLEGKLQKTLAKRKAQAAEATAKTLKESPTEAVDKAIDRATLIIKTLNAKGGGKMSLTPVDPLQPLNPEDVAIGRAIRNSIANTGEDGMFSSGLDISTVRSLAGAMTELYSNKKIDIKPGERIMSAVNRVFQDPKSGIDGSDFLQELRDKYDLTKSQVGLIWLSDMSDHGRGLGIGGSLSRALSGKKKNLVQPKVDTEYQKALSDLTILRGNGHASISDLEVADLLEAVVKNTENKTNPLISVRGTYDLLKEIDQTRIAFMTSQPATTARNVASTVLLAGVDILDQSFKALFAGIKGDRTAFKGIFNTIKGLSWGIAESSLMRDMLKKEMPQEYLRTFHDTLRLEVGTKSHSAFAKVGRAVNFMNTATDTVFKEAAFYSSIDRELRILNNKKLGTNVQEFIRRTGRLDALTNEMADGLKDKGTSIIDKALDDANRFTMQRTYAQDESAFGQGARIASKVNEKLPFVMSGIMGIPFPRYVANHLEMIADYTPFLGSFMGRLEGKSKLTRGGKGKPVTLFGDAYKSAADRRARHYTGMSLITAGYMLAREKEGEIDYKSLENQIKGEEDIASSLGFIIAPIYIGDMIYRYQAELPMDNWFKDTSDVLAGVGELGMDTTGARNVIEAMFTEHLDAKDDAAKLIGNIFSTFTYPVTAFRDLQGQLNYDSSGSPYTRPIGEDDKVSSDQRVGGLFTSQATRFLPDYAMIQWSQSHADNPDYDLKYYSILTPQPIATINPLKKTFTGVQASPTLTGLGREFNKLKIEEREVYSNRRIKNNVLDYIVRYDLSRNLSDDFESWRKVKVFNTGEEAGKTYDEMSSGAQRENLKKWVTHKKEESEAHYTDLLNSLSERNPKAARGFVRNNYQLKVIELGVEKFNKATKYISDGKYSSAEEYLSNAEDIPQEIRWRQKLIQVAASERFNVSGEDIKD